MDPITARRTLFGEPVVHGLHLVLWALDTALARAGGPTALAELRATFRRPARLGAPCQLVDEGSAGASLRLAALGPHGPVLQLQALLGDAPPASPPPDEAPGRAVRTRTFDESARASGALPLLVERAALARAFPALSARLPLVQAAELLATTRLVGAECPGLHSLFAGLTLGRASVPAQALDWSVRAANRRFSMLTLQVAGPTLAGTLDAFYRPPPRPPLTAEEVWRVVGPADATGQRALVVGGSRGLGEAVAQVVAAGGGEVCLTWHRGETEARMVVDEVVRGGGRAAAVQLDALEPEGLATRWPVDWRPTHLYYFATPFIRIDRAVGFDPAAFAALARTYVEGLHRTASAAVTLASPLVVVAPSTALLDEESEPGTAAYCAAKAAMEELCRRLPDLLPVRVLAPRLPRTDTDQTASLLGTQAASPLEVARTVVRLAQELRPSASGPR